MTEKGLNMHSHALYYVYLNTWSWNQVVHKVVGEAFGIFNEIAVFLDVLHIAKNLKVSPQWLAHLQKPVGNYF